MALKVVSMNELKLEVLLEPARTGESVAEVCLRRGLSRASFYRYRRRYLEEGPAGLEPRSRRPRASPGQIESALEAEICALRQRHPRWGARRIHAELRRAGIAPPAVATIHRALRRNHLVAARPRRKAKADKRFERECPNDLWQIDATQVALQGGEEAWVVDCLDDHARVCLCALACERPHVMRPGIASPVRPLPMGCRASSSPTTARSSPAASWGWRSPSSAGWPRSGSSS